MDDDAEESEWVARMKKERRSNLVRAREWKDEGKEDRILRE